MKSRHFMLESVQPELGPAGGAEGCFRLQLQFADGERMQVDLASRIHGHEVLGRLRDERVFLSARLGPFGRSVHWPQDDRLSIGADSLRAWALEQAGQLSHEYLWTWMHRHALDLEAAAQALGVSRRELLHHRSGQRPLPRWLALACLGWEALRGGTVHAPPAPWQL